MVIVYIGIAMASVGMLAVFVDQLPSDLRSRRAPVCEEVCYRSVFLKVSNFC